MAVDGLLLCVHVSGLGSHVVSCLLFCTGSLSLLGVALTRMYDCTQFVDCCRGESSQAQRDNAVLCVRVWKWVKFIDFACAMELAFGSSYWLQCTLGRWRSSRNGFVNLCERDCRWDLLGRVLTSMTSSYSVGRYTRSLPIKWSFEYNSILIIELHKKIINRIPRKAFHHGRKRKSVKFVDHSSGWNDELITKSLWKIFKNIIYWFPSIFVSHWTFKTNLLGID